MCCLFLRCISKPVLLFWPKVSNMEKASMNSVPTEQNRQASIKRRRALSVTNLDLSEEGQTIGLSLTDTFLTKGSEELEESDDDLRSIVTAKKRWKPILEYGCSPGAGCVRLIIEKHSSIAIRKQTLQDASPYFSSLLKYNDERIRMVPPANVHEQRFVALLHSLSNSQPPAVDECNMWDFFVLARYFLLQPLEDTCRRVIRQALPTMTMDEFCRLWRRARAEQCEDMTRWFLAGMVRNLDQAGETMEFLQFDFEELMIMLSDDECLPLFEEHVYKGIIDWCEYIPEERMTRDIVDVLLAEIVWDHFNTQTIRDMTSSAPPPLQSALENIAINATDRKKPKRAVERHVIFAHKAFVQRECQKSRTREFLLYDCLRGTVRVWNAPAARTLCTEGTWRYVAHDLKVGHPTVIFQKERDFQSSNDVMVVVNLTDGKAGEIGNGLSERYFDRVLMEDITCRRAGASKAPPIADLDS